jgi:iron complex transport system ATP-binding protein
MTLTAESLTVGYRPGRVVSGPLTVALAPGELACLIGPNGAGKSTLLRTLAGMQPPLAGRVFLGDRDLHQLAADERARNLAIVLTERVDDPHLSVYGLVALGRHPHTDWRGQLSERDHGVVRAALVRTGAAELAERRLNTLSDGERQRVLVARALAQEPRVLVLDEPTAFLDLPRRVALMQLLRRLAREARCAVVLSTHDLDLALRLSDQLWVMDAQGVLAVDIPEAHVLGGTLAAAFAADGLHFDPASGHFVLERQTCGPIAVAGEGPAALWTGRALERIGYELVAHAPEGAPRVRVGDAEWQLTLGADTQRFARLVDLLERLRGDTLA